MSEETKVIQEEKTPILEVEDLSMTFRTKKRGKKLVVNAIDHNSFKVYKGETFGLVGESGCGKTTTGRAIIRLYNPNSGKIILNGRDISGKMTKEKRHYITSNAAMIFQDPIDSLNPRMTVEEIIGEGLKVRGMKDKEERRKLIYEMLERVGLTREHATRYPHEFSGGQRQRIGIARALIVKPSLIIADEPVSALDVSIQAQVINLLSKLKEEMGLTIIFIAHNLSVVKYFSDRIAVMYYGKIVELTEADELYRHPMHPYTRALLSAVPQPNPLTERDRKRITYVPAESHDYSVDKPSMQEVLPGHFVYCNNAELERYRQEFAD